MTDKAQLPTNIRPLLPVEQEYIERFKKHGKLSQDIFQAAKDADDGKEGVEPAYTTGLSPEDTENEFCSRAHATTGASSRDVGTKLLISAANALFKADDSIDEGVRHLRRRRSTPKYYR